MQSQKKPSTKSLCEVDKHLKLTCEPPLATQFDTSGNSRDVNLKTFLEEKVECVDFSVIDSKHGLDK